MNFKIGRDSGVTEQQEHVGGKKSQNARLALLLILIGGFAYLYFFTGLIKPEETRKVAEPPAPTPQIVKMPIPARSTEPVHTEGKSETAKTVAVVPAAKPATVAATAAPVPPQSKTVPAAVSVKTAVETKKVDTLKPADKKPVVSPSVTVKSEKPAVAKGEMNGKKSVTDGKKAPATKVAKKQGNGARPVAAVAAKESPASSASWSLVAGNYVLEEALSADLGRIRKSGFTPTVKPGVGKITPMNRLLVAEYGDRAAGQAALQRLRHFTSDAFVIEQGGKFSVYAGSYLQTDAAHIESDRLKAAGVPTSVKRVDIAIPTHSLILGPFSSGKEADTVREKLLGMGIKVTKVQK